LIDAHSHIGYMRDLTSGPQNYTRENILDHMHKFAYFGVAASLAMGSDFGELPYQLRDEIAAGKYPAAARFLTAGRGLAPIDEIKPNNMRHSAILVETEDDARKAVRELSARKVTMIKTWVDSRGGTVRKLEPHLYKAIIDEAHKNNQRVIVHATGLADVKELLRANVDGLAHMVGTVDDELMDLLKARPNVYFMLALGGLRRQLYSPWLNPPIRSLPRPCGRRRSSGCRIAWRSPRPMRRRLGSASRAVSRDLRWQACASASAPTAAGSRATNSSAGQCMRNLRTWSWPA